MNNYLRNLLKYQLKNKKEMKNKYKLKKRP